MHICQDGACHSPLVYPRSWEEIGDDYWHVELRCPDCETVTDGIFTAEEVRAFDGELDNGTLDLVRDLRDLTRDNMEKEIGVFVAGLSADAILPEDF